MPRGGRAKPPNTPTGGPMKRTLLFTALVPLLALAGARSSGPEDESVFVTGLRAGQHESLLYVWTSDADAKDPDFLSVVDAHPKSPSYAKVIATAPTGSTVDNEAHHFGYTVNTRSEEHTSELQSRQYLVCRLLLEKKKKKTHHDTNTVGSPPIHTPICTTFVTAS